MIKIVENNDNKLIIKKYPTKYWLSCMILTIFAFIVNYGVFFVAPIYSSLSCNKGWLNTTNCEITESSLFHKNLLHQKVDRIDEPKGILGNGTIWLTTKIDLLHNQIENIYYPGHSFLGFFDVYLYRFHWQAVQEVNQINSFIDQQNNRETLILIRKIPVFFYIPFLLLPLTIAISVICILVQPIDTYIFDIQQNCLVVKNRILSTVEEKTYPLDRLKIAFLTTADNDRPSSILINIDKQKLTTFKDFQNTSEALNLFNLLKQYIR